MPTNNDPPAAASPTAVGAASLQSRAAAADAAHAADAPRLEPVPARRHGWLLLGVVIVLIAAVVGLTAYALDDHGRQTTNDAFLDGRIVQMSPRVSGQVVALRVDDNTHVDAGDVLVQIDPADYQARLDTAEASVSTADAGVDQAAAKVTSAEAQIGVAWAAARSAAAVALQKTSDWKRYEALGTEGVSEQQLDTAKTAADAAALDRDGADKKLDAARAAANEAATGVESAKSQARSARAQLQLAKLNLDWTRIVAPESGKVTGKHVEVGTYVSTAQPLFAVIPDEVWLVANYKEIQLGAMKVGQPAGVTVDTFPDRTFRGRVESIQAGTGGRFALLPPENATGNWVKVVQRVPVKITFDPGQDLSGLTQGMSAEVTVDTRVDRKAGP